MKCPYCGHARDFQQEVTVRIPATIAIDTDGGFLYFLGFKTHEAKEEHIVDQSRKWKCGECERHFTPRTIFKRMWINQPSTLQQYHDLHGTNVLASPSDEQIIEVFFTEGSVISMMIYRSALSDGWNTQRASQRL